MAGYSGEAVNTAPTYLCILQKDPSTFAEHHRTCRVPCIQKQMSLGSVRQNARSIGCLTR